MDVDVSNRCSSYESKIHSFHLPFTTGEAMHRRLSLPITEAVLFLSVAFILILSITTSLEVNAFLPRANLGRQQQRNQKIFFEPTQSVLHASTHNINSIMPEKDRNTMTDLMKPGFTAVVTGASSGIGRAAATHFCAAGMHVFMADIDEEELKLAKEMVQSRCTADNQMVQAYAVDVSDANKMNEFAEKVFAATGGKCHILMNNAGVGLGGGPMTDMETVEKVVSINTYGPIHGCLAFLPKMKESEEPGIVVNTGSKQGITMPPGNLTYNLSKAALKCYTEGLGHELDIERLDGKGKLRAALLVPGWVNTSILLKAERTKAEKKGLTYDPSSAFFHEENPQPGAWMPNQMFDFMVQELDKGSFYIICPDNDVDPKTDKLRISWTADDIVKNRPPLSRWHPDFKKEFNEYVRSSSTK